MPRLCLRPYSTTASRPVFTVQGEARRALERLYAKRDKDRGERNI